MSNGRVTIACTGCDCIEATHINYAWWANAEPPLFIGSPVCPECADSEVMSDRRIRETYDQDGPRGRWIAWTDRLINPGLCSESDVLAVRTAIEAMCRLLRTRGDSPEDIEDRAVLELCAQEVRDTYYRRCEGIYHSYSGPRWEPCEWRAVDDCKHCNGSGLVPRRRADGTAVIDEIDAGSVAA